MFIGAALVLGVVLVLLIVSLLAGRSSGAEPLSSRRAWGMVVAGGLALPATAAFGVVVASLYVGGRSAAAPAGEFWTVEVTGRRWWWELRYFDPGGALRAVTANELHLPAGERTRIELLSDNVIHSFWAPSLKGKTDAVPGQVNRLWLEPAEPGTYRGQCAEFCGVQHALMGFTVVAEPVADFAAWIEAQAAQAAAAALAPEHAFGLEVFGEAGCNDCHTIRGTAADGEIGPDLTHVASRSTLAAATLPNTRGHLGGWISDPQNVKPGALMPSTPLAADELHALIGLLEALE
jgi:cytochrome c oxidase subunit 2